MNTVAATDSRASPKATVTVPGRIELIVGGGDEGKALSFYERSCIVTVAAGQPLARLLPPGEDDPSRVHLGANVQLAPDGQTIIATAAGRLCQDHQRIWVEKVLQISGDVDFSIGNIEFENDVHIHGGILDLFKVRSGGSIFVDKAVEAAEVHCAADLFVKGGIAGKEKGHCVVGRNLHARFLSNARIEVSGDITVGTEVCNCHIHCGGRLDVEHGPLLSGEVAATGGMRCHTLGCSSGVRTVVTAGGDEAFAQSTSGHFAQIEQTRPKIVKTRQLVEPLMRNQKSLNAQQKEKATELLFQADEMEKEINGRMEELKRSLAQIREREHREIRVSTLIHPGVVLRFPGMEAAVSETLRGPLRIVPHIQAHSRRIVLISSGGSSVPLETRTPDDPMEMVQRFLDRAEKPA
jgi:hypothetical protein